MKQTAVQWLIDEYFGGMENCTPDFQHHINKALEMEKEQMHKCASFWRGKENAIEKPIFEQYYNENFKSE